MPAGGASKVCAPIPERRGQGAQRHDRRNEARRGEAGIMVGDRSTTARANTSVGGG